MYIFNIHFSNKFLLKSFSLLLIILFIFLLFISMFKVFSKEPLILEINTENFTSFLKDCHENIPKYVDTKVKISGYVYRMNDFTSNQFVVARSMLISDKHFVVVGILCETSTPCKFKDYDWVEVVGTIKKCDYHGDIPCIKVEQIKKINSRNEFVKEPVSQSALSNIVLNIPLSNNGP